MTAYVPELLRDLSSKALPEFFGRLALAAWKLPVPLEVHAARTPRDEKSIVLLDDRRGDDDARARIGVRPQVRQSTMSPRVRL